MVLQENEELYNLQKQEWDPVIEWFNKRFNVNIEKCQNIAGPVVSEETKAVVVKHLLSHNFPAVVGNVDKNKNIAFS